MFGEKLKRCNGQTRQQFHHHLEAEDIGMAVVKFKNGAIATIEGTTKCLSEKIWRKLCMYSAKEGL